jgi:phosphoribosylformimino-5-aminoimidazole carboxamide ribotide isomerase
MRIVPVMDLSGGQVVRGIAGRREEYRPIRGSLSPTSNPADVAWALVHGLQREQAYVADLDAIAGGEPSWETLKTMASAGLRLWVDAGVRDCAAAKELADFSIDDRGTATWRIVVALETIAGPGALEAILHTLGPQRLVFSLDLNDGRPLAASSHWRDLQPLRIACEVAKMGVRRMIVLDLAFVGTGQGVATLDLCRQIATRVPNMQIATGGGVSSTTDLMALAAAGVDVALVASAIHDGRITRADIEAVESSSNNAVG